jgi:four helix bundle protein
MTTFDHERLDVYQVAIEFAGDANGTANEFPMGQAPLAEQLRRAATSICLNIAEGAGEFSPREKARFYRMAKRSATECAAVLDVAKAWSSSATQLRERLDAGKEKLERIVSMLIKLARRLDNPG